jgi:hypothetical protein
VFIIFRRRGTPGSSGLSDRQGFSNFRDSNFLKHCFDTSMGVHHFLYHYKIHYNSSFLSFCISLLTTELLHLDYNNRLLSWGWDAGWESNPGLPWNRPSPCPLSSGPSLRSNKQEMVLCAPSSFCVEITVYCTWTVLVTFFIEVSSNNITHTHIR